MGQSNNLVKSSSIDMHKSINAPSDPNYFGDRTNENLDCSLERLKRKVKNIKIR